MNIAGAKTKLPAVIGSDWASGLRGLASEAERTLDLVSPWVSYGTLDRLMGWVSEGVKVKLLIRWPVEGSEAPLIAGACIPDLVRREDLEIRYAPPCCPLHAKAYVSDGVRALVGSANLTGAGTGLGSPAGQNRELGVLVEGDAARDVAEWAEGEWEDACTFTEAAIETLMQWLRQPRVGDVSPPPPPPPDAPSLSELAEQVIRRMVERGYIDADYEPVPVGFGRRAYRIRRPKAQADTIVRVHLSRPEARGASQAYHFGFYSSDVKHARRAGQKASHVVFAPLSGDGTALVEDMPIVAVPINSVFKPKDQRPRPRQLLDPDYFREPKKGSKERTTMTAFLEPHGRGWQLRVPTPGIRRKKEALIPLPRRWLVL